MRNLLLLPLTLAIATPVWADETTDRLAEIAHFFQDATVLSGPLIVDCTLSGGTQATCFSITVKAEPQAYQPGPWCPTSITDTADAGGIWLQDGVVHDVDGDFVANLSTFYNDDWQLHNPETGEVRVTDTQTSCEAAARPDVDPEYNNYCVQCLPEYMDDDASMTYVIPLEPQRANRPNPTNFAGAGIAFNGVRLDGPAPVEDILAAHTIAPFDDCGGHVNTHVGYHYHAVTDCLEDSPVSAADAPQIGIAMDGYAIYSTLLVDGTAPVGLDQCNGHFDETLGYHYHAGQAGSNAILPCLTAQTGCAAEDSSQSCDASARPRRP